jgi:uncharacterized membrane protein
LDGESHKCAPKSSSTIGALTGALTGAVGGFLIVLLGYGFVTESAQSGILAIVFGVPFGALVGALIGARAGRA